MEHLLVVSRRCVSYGSWCSSASGAGVRCGHRSSLGPEAPAAARRLEQPGRGWKTAAMGTEPRQGRWPAHLPVGALRVVRWSARYEETVTFYRDTIGLPVLEAFHDSYGLDGTILGMPGGQVHLEIVRLRDAPYPASGLDQLVFYL